MRGRYRVLAASLIGASLSLGVFGVGVASAGASSKTTTPAATSSSGLSTLSSLLPSLPAIPTLSSLLPSLPTTSSLLPPVCTELAGTPLCGTASTIAAIQEVSAIQNWLQEFTTMLAAKVPALP
jgi:hypothetical protein